jgi:hypothetical protein
VDRPGKQQGMKNNAAGDQFLERFNLGELLSLFCGFRGCKYTFARRLPG